MRYRRWLLAAGAAVVILTIAASVMIPLLVDTARVRALIAGAASEALGRSVKVASVSVAVLPLPTVVLRGLEVADDPRFGPAPFLALDRGEIRLRLAPLLTGRFELGDLLLRKPRLTVIQGTEGRWNVGSLGAGPEPRTASRPARGGGTASAGAVLPSRLTIKDGVVAYVVRGAADTASEYRVENLDLTVTGRGSLLAFEGDARVKPGDLSVKVAGGSIGLTGAQSLLEAPLRARVTLNGQSLAALIRGASGSTSAIDGALRATLALAGTVSNPSASGDIELTNVTVMQVNPQCPGPKRRMLTASPLTMNAAWQEGRLTGRPVTARLAGGTLTANLTATFDGGVRVDLTDLTVTGLPVEKVLVDFLCEGYAVSGPLELSGATSLGPGDLWSTLSGSGRLRIGPGKVVGSQALALMEGVVRVGGAISALLSADLPVALFSSPLDFDSITGTYQITNGVVTTRDLFYRSRAMTVAVTGEYGLATGTMNLDAVVNHGRGEVKAKLTGTAASPSISVAPSTILREVDAGKLKRGLQDVLKRLR